MKIHLISYASKKYAVQKELFKETAIASSFFDSVTTYGPEYIDPVFRKEFQAFFNQQIGEGYWIWKPYLIKKILSTLPTDDILIYADAGWMINSRAKQRFEKYITILKESATGSLAFELAQKEVANTKQEVFAEFNLSSKTMISNQLSANVILLKKCAHAVLLVDKWYDVLRKKPLLFTNDKNTAIQQVQFKGHHHDQSIFSIVRQLYGTDIIKGELFFTDLIREGYRYPFWATSSG